MLYGSAHPVELVFDQPSERARAECIVSSDVSKTLEQML